MSEGGMSKDDSEYLVSRGVLDTNVRGLLTPGRTLGMAQAGWVAPRDTKVVSGRLQWNDLHPETPKLITPGDAILPRFIDLVDRSDNAFLVYALTWGTLNLCASGFPATNAYCQQCSSRMDENVACQVARAAVFAPSSSNGYREPTAVWLSESIDHWRMYSAVARAIVMAQAALNAGTLPHPDAIELIGKWQGAVDLRRFDPSRIGAVRIDTERGSAPSVRESTERKEFLGGMAVMITSAVDRWCQLGNVMPRIAFIPAQQRDWKDTTSLEGTYRETLSANGLFGAIGLALRQSITGGNVPKLCKQCGNPFTPKQRNQTYCGEDECNKRRDAARQYKSQHKYVG